MNYYFDIESLNMTLQDFYRLTQIRIVVFDSNFEEIASYPKERAAICTFARKNKQCDDDCKLCDRNACTNAKKSLKAYVYKCHLGLNEIIYPLHLAGVTIGYLFFSHMLCYSTKEEAIKAIASSCRKYGFNENTIAELLSLQPLVSYDFIISASHLLKAVSTYLCYENATFLKYEDTPIRLIRYLDDNLNKNITIEIVSNALGVSKTKLCLLSKEMFQEGLAEHIRKLKIEKAKALLLSGSIEKIYEVADQCGFDDYNYFITVFKKEVGVTPKKFLANNLKK